MRSAPRSTTISFRSYIKDSQSSELCTCLLLHKMVLQRTSSKVLALQHWFCHLSVLQIRSHTLSTFLACFSAQSPYLLTPLIVHDLNNQFLLLSCGPWHQRTLSCGPRHQQSPKTHLMTRPESSPSGLPWWALSFTLRLKSFLLHKNFFFVASFTSFVQFVGLLHLSSCIFCQFLVCTLFATLSYNSCIQP